MGSTVRVEAAGKGVECVLDKAHEPNFVPSPDRVERKEVYERRWAALDVGTLALPKGRTRLTVRAVKKAGSAVMDLKAIRVKRMD